MHYPCQSDDPSALRQVRLESTILWISGLWQSGHEIKVYSLPPFHL